MVKKYKVSMKVRRAIESALSDIREGVVSFDADKYEPIISDWLDSLDAEDQKGKTDEQA